MSDVVTIPTRIPAGIWNLDPRHSAVRFQIKHMGFARIHGQFRTFEGRIEVDADRGILSASGTVDAASVDTNQPKRDAHLRSADFFEVETFPVISFVATSIDPLDAETVRLAGDFTMHGVTRELVLDARIVGLTEGHDGNQRLGLAIEARVDRNAFGVSYNRVVGGVSMLPNEVDIALDLQAIPAG